MAVQNGERIQAVGIGEPADAACRDAGEAPTHIVAAAQLGLFGDQQAQQRAPDISKADIARL